MVCLAEEACSEYHSIQAGVPQGSVLGPILLLPTADVPVTSEITLVVFAYDTAIMAVSDTQTAATEQRQGAIDSLNKWTRQWRIRLNEQKSIHMRTLSNLDHDM